MGRPPGSRNKAADSPESPNLSNRPPGLTPEQTLEFLGEWAVFQLRAQRLTADKAEWAGRVKGKGGNPVNLKRVAKWQDMDSAEASKELTDLMAMARQAGINTTWEADGQAAFADFMQDNEPAAPTTSGSRQLHAARAMGDGYNSGKQGGNADGNPNLPGSEEFVAWENGFGDGRADRERVKAAKPQKDNEKVAANASVD